MSKEPESAPICPDCSGTGVLPDGAFCYNETYHSPEQADCPCCGYPHCGHKHSSDAGMPQSPAPQCEHGMLFSLYEEDDCYELVTPCPICAYAASLRGEIAALKETNWNTGTKPLRDKIEALSGELKAARQQLKESSLDRFLGDSLCGHRKQFLRATVDAQDVPDSASECLACQNAALVAENTRLKEALQEK